MSAPESAEFPEGDGAASQSAGAASQSTAGLLGIYLNDHLAGATGGMELARRAAGEQRGSPAGEVLERYAAEIAKDREALLDMMHALDVPVRRYKVVAGWAGEKLGRLKPNGTLFERSPLSSLVELEALRLGVEGKVCGWRILRRVAEHDNRLDANRLEDLLSRAKEQAETLEELRAGTAAKLFGSR